jgi:DNA-binding NarL/FixJ family response regulator
MIRGLRDIFRSSRDTIYLAANAGSAAEAIATVSPGQFEVIILDFFLGDANPLVNIGQLTAHFTGKPVIIYSGHTGIGLMKQAFDAGVRAWIVKTAGKQEIRDTIARVQQGVTIYPQAMIQLQVATGRHAAVHPSFQHFNPDPDQVVLLDLLCEGFTTSEIASVHLKMTLSTVEKKLQVMRELFEVKTNCELVVLYLRRFGSNR